MLKNRLRPAEYARLRGLNPSTVSRQIRDGKIPITEAGLVDVKAADRARDRNLDGDRRARAERKKRKQLPSHPRAQLHDIVAGPADSKTALQEAVQTGQRDVLDRIRRRAADLPRLLKELGAPAPAVAIAAAAFESMFWAALGDDIERLYGPDGPPPIELGPGDDSEMEAAADVLLDRIESFFEQRLEREPRL